MQGIALWQKLMILGLFGGFFSSVSANELQQLDQQQQALDQARNRQLDRERNNQPNVSFDVPAEPVNIAEMDSQCIDISSISLLDFHTSQKTSQFNTALSKTLSELDLSLPICIGSNGLQALMKTFQNQLLAQGYVTSRVLIQEQDLTSGELQLTVVTGKIGKLLIEDHSPSAWSFFGPYGRFSRLTSFTALPFSTGDTLKLADLEQGVENLRRVPTVEANVEIQPTEQIGVSDLKFSYAQQFPVRFMVGVDDSGSKSTGKYQGFGSISLDNLFTANDLFYGYYSHAIPSRRDDSGRRSSHNFNLYYSIPFGYWSLNLSAWQNRYYQAVQGYVQNYEYSGKSKGQKLSVSYVLNRSSQRKTTVTAGLWARQSNNYIDQAEIEVQRRRIAGWEVNIAHREYIHQAILDITLGYKRGTGARKALAAPEEEFNEGTSRMKIFTTDLTLTLPFTVGKQRFQYISEFSGQWNRTPLTYIDRFNIGGRYSIRGFDGELSLSGNRGFTFRNELAWQALDSLQFYAALDYGKVYGQIEDSVGKELLGGVIGLRGELWGLNYDAFVGTPLEKPTYFRADKTTTGFRVSYQF